MPSFSPVPEDLERCGLRRSDESCLPSEPSRGLLPYRCAICLMALVSTCGNTRLRWLQCKTLSSFFTNRDCSNTREINLKEAQYRWGIPTELK